MRVFLSSERWLPIATISYSLYLFHLMVAEVEALRPYTVEDKDICPGGMVYNLLLRLGYIALVMAIGSLVATCCYIHVEKPSIDARRVLK